MKKYAAVSIFIILLTGCNSDSDNVVDNGGGINDISLTPAVIWTDPLPGSVGPNIMSPGNVVKIRFNKLMNTRSVIRAVSISPSNETVFIDTTRSTPVEGTTFDFPLTPTPIWLVLVKDVNLDSRFPPSYQVYYPYFKVAQQYTISVDPSALDIYGNTLASKYTFVFTPEPYLRVTDNYPLKSDTGISPAYSSISVRFNAMIDTGTVRAAFQISPSVAGEVYLYSNTWGISWSQASNSMFASETQYTATVVTTLKDVDGHLLNSPYSFSFTTAPYRVTYGYPTGTSVSLTSSIGINCNFLIDSTTMAKSFTINPTINGKFQYNTASFSFVPASNLSPNTTYTVTVSTGLHGKNGTPMKSAYSYSFTTGN